MGADLAQVMALHSAPPVLTATSCLLGFQQGMDPGTGTYLGTADTVIASDAPGTNFGTAALEYLDGSPVRQLLLRFDGLVGLLPGQVPPNAAIQKATLTLTTGAGAAASAGSHSVHRLLQPFDAATITWASGFGGNGVQADDAEATAAAVGTVPPMTANQTLTIGVTAAVQAWADLAPNHGFVVLPGSDDGLGLMLAEATLATLRPALSVEVAGSLAFATEVAGFAPMIISGEPAACYLDPTKALGAPDTPDDAPTTGCCDFSPIPTVTLGVGGSVSLKFTTVSISGNGSPEPDLWIYEQGPDVEDTFVDLSTDGVNWISVGKVYGATPGLDIDAFGDGPLDLFSYVRLTDDPAEGQITGCAVGADIDAVAAVTPNPWVNLGSSLAGTLGAPQLGGAGALLPGNTVQFQLGNALPNSSANSIVGASALNAPFKGGVLVPYPDVLILGLPTGLAGALLLSPTWPAGVPAGYDIFVQFWIADAGAVKGYAATNAPRSVTQ